MKASTHYHYVGLDVHKKIITFCEKEIDGVIVEQGAVAATRSALEEWGGKRKTPWIGAMEATLFSGWIYDALQPHAAQLQMAHPEMVKAIAWGKKKNDRIDAKTLADLLRCNLLPTCYVAPPRIRELRRALRFRNLMVRQAVKMQNKMNGLLMEVGVEYETKKLSGKKYFRQLSESLQSLDYVSDNVIEMLGYSRSAMDMFNATQKTIKRALVKNPLIGKRVARLMTVPGIGEMTALTWVLEICDPQRFSNINKAVSYCGLCSRQNESAGKQKRGPVSKKRNKHLQTILIEAANLAPRFNENFAAVYQKEFERTGTKNKATMAVARNIVAVLLAMDKNETVYDKEHSGNLGEKNASFATVK